MKESVHSVETASKTNFMSCFNVRSIMRFANPFIDMHVHMKNRLIPMTKLRSSYFCSAAPKGYVFVPKPVFQFSNVGYYFKQMILSFLTNISI